MIDGQLKKNRNHLMNLLVQYWNSQTIFTAAKLGLFISLSKGSKSVSQLADELELSHTSTLKLLRGLFALDLIHLNEEEKVQLSSMGSLLVPDQVFGSLGHAALLWGAEHYSAWQHLETALRQERPVFEELFGKTYFEWLEDHPEQRKVYHNAIKEYAEWDYYQFSKLVDFSHHRVIMDVGGSCGVLLGQFLNEYPHLKGILIEMKGVIESARSNLHNLGVLSKIEIISHNFFEPLPRKADGIILSRILHDWDDTSALLILKNCYDALHSNGYLYIIELCRPDERSSCGSLLDLNMLIMTGGRERSLNELKELSTRIGLSFRWKKSLETVSMVFCFQKKGNEEKQLNKHFNTEIN